MYISVTRQEDGTLRWLRTSTQRRNGIYIIDLQKSVGKVDEAYKAIADIAADGGNHPFRRNQEAGSGCHQDRSRALRYVLCKREMAGRYAYKLQDNPVRIARLKQIETMSEDGTFDVLPKKEVIALKKEWGRNWRRTSAESRK